MCSHKLILVALCIVGIVVLVAAVAWNPGSPVRAEVVRIEAADIFDSAAQEYLLVTIRLQSRGPYVVRLAGEGQTFEARIAGRWISQPDGLGFLQTISGPFGREETLLLPAGTEYCRLNLRYEPEEWRLRLFRALGQRGQKRAYGALPRKVWDWLTPYRYRWAPPPYKQPPPVYRPLTLTIRLPRHAEPTL
jgi:hypothetical protein